MLRKRVLVSAVATLMVVAGSALVVPTEADACSLPHTLRATIPADGDVIPPDAELSAWFKPDSDWVFGLVDGDGDEVDVEIEVRQYGVGESTVGHHRLVPETLLKEDSGPYIWTLTQHNREYEISFEVVEESVEPPSAPEDAIWSWRYNFPPDDCTGPSGHWNRYEIDEDREDVWFEFRYETEGEEVVASHAAFEPLSHYMEDRTRCVTMEAVAIDGSRSEPMERCEPDDCRVGAGDGSWDSNEADCSTIDGDFDLDDFLASQEDGDHEDEGHENGGESTCATAGGSPTSVLWAVMMVGLMGALRRSKV